MDIGVADTQSQYCDQATSCLQEEQEQVFGLLNKTILCKLVCCLDSDSAERRKTAGRFICQLLRSNMPLRLKFFQALGLQTHGGYMIINRVPDYLTARPHLFLDIMTRLKYSSVSSEQFYSCVYWYIDPKNPYDLHYVNEAQFVNGGFVDTREVLFGLTFHQNYMEKQKKKQEGKVNFGRNYMKTTKIEEFQRSKKIVVGGHATDRSPMVSTVASHETSMSQESYIGRTYNLWMPKDNEPRSPRIRLTSLSPKNIAVTYPDCVPKIQTKNTFYRLESQITEPSSHLVDITKKQAEFDNLRSRFDSRLKNKNNKK